MTSSVLMTDSPPSPTPDPTPQPKIVAAGVSGALTTLVLYGLSTVGVTVPPEVAAAITALLAVAAGYLTPNR